MIGPYHPEPAGSLYDDPAPGGATRPRVEAANSPAHHPPSPVASPPERVESEADERRAYRVGWAVLALVFLALAWGTFGV